MGVLLGVAVWLVSRVPTGGAEPWDADAPIWLASWLLVAVAGGFAGVARGAGLTVGYGLGQMLVTARSVLDGEFGALGWVFIAGYTLAATGAALGVGWAVALVRHLARGTR